MSMIGGRFPQSVDDVGQTVASFPDVRSRAEGRLDAHRRRDPGARHRDRRAGSALDRTRDGRLGYATAARSGAINGVLLGLLFSAILVIGIAVGADPGLRRRALRRHRDRHAAEHHHLLVRPAPRDFASVMQVVADHYEVTIAAGSVQRARQVLGRQAAPSRNGPRRATPRRYAAPPPRADRGCRDRAAPLRRARRAGAAEPRRAPAERGRCARRTSAERPDEGDASEQPKP